jgi:hypothetical protein
MKKLALALSMFLAVLAVPRTASAQAIERDPAFRVAPYVGAFVPTGRAHEVLDNSALAGVTASYDFMPYLAQVLTFSWAPTSLKGLSKGGLDVFQYDAGIQGQVPFAVGRGVVLEPFAGLGMGGRTYRFRDLARSSETDFCWYAALGTSLQYRAATLSLAVRDTVSTWDGLGATVDTSTRNDLGFMLSAGVRF